MGAVGELAYDADGEGADPRRRAVAVPVGRPRRDERRVRGVRRPPPATSARPSASGGRSCSPATSPTTSRRPAPSPRRRGGARSRAPTGRHPAGPQSDARRTGAPSRRPRVVGRRRRLLRVAGHPPAHRGRVGARRARRPAGRHVPVGRRAGARWAPRHERVPGSLPRRRHGRRWLHRDGTGRRLRAERLRDLQHDRQRVGVVRRLVLADVLPPQRPPRSARSDRAARTG